ncbi:hypothetical protein AB0L22_09195 [Micromonospora haikouensis]|uniref:hypothetical protein n=1 Tax=Micromonospora haikouensis TaxID=686309 RepID=UPI00344A2A26
MCGCAGHNVCGYHTELITDLIERLTAAETAGDGEARSLRGELRSYGLRAEIVRNKLAKEANR